MMRPRLGFSSFVGVFAFACWLFSIGARPVSAQAPVVPESSNIVGYIRLVDPRALDAQMPVFLRPAGLEGVLPGFVPLLAAWTGDPNLELAIPQRPVTIVWLRDRGGNISNIVILPEAANLNHLAASARRVGKYGVVENGMSLIGFERAMAQAGPLLPALKKLHEAVHPADVSCYFRASLWADRMDAVLGFLAEPDLDGIKPLLNLPEGGGLPTMLGAAPTPPPKKTPVVPFALRVAGRILQDVEMIHLMLEPGERPARFALRLKARDNSPLARFFQQPSAPTNPVACYLPDGGSLRAALMLDMDLFETFTRTAMEQAARESGDLFVASLQQMQERCTRFFLLKGMGSVYLNDGALDAPFRDLNHFLGNWLLRAVQNSSFLPHQTAELQKRIRAAFFPTAAGARVHKTEFVVIATPRQGRKFIESVQTRLSDPYPENSPQEIVLVSKNAQAEEFGIDQFFVAPRHSARPLPTLITAPHRAVLSVCRIGNYLVLASGFEDIKKTLSRILRMDPLAAPMTAHQLFLDGGHLYADIRWPSVRTAPDPNAPLVCVTARFLDHYLQIAGALP